MNAFERFVHEHLNWEWKIFRLSENPNITPEFVEQHPHLNWDIKSLSKNPNITHKFVLRHPDWKWDECYIAENPNIQPGFVMQHMRRGIYGLGLARRSDLTAKFAARYLRELNPYGCCSTFAKNPCVTPEFVRTHKMKWDMMGLSENPNLTPEFILERSGWDMWRLSQNPSVSLQFVEQHPEMKWRESGLTRHPDLTMEFIERHPEFDWKLYDVWSKPNFYPYAEGQTKYEVHARYLSGNPLLTESFVSRHLDWDWNRATLLMNRNISLQFMIENFDLSNYAWWVSAHPDITPEFMDRYPHLIDAGGLSVNRFTKMNQRQDRQLQPFKQMCVLIAFMRANCSNPLKNSILDIARTTLW